MKLSEKRFRKYWGNLEELPIMETLNNDLRELGFNNTYSTDSSSGFVDYYLEVGKDLVIVSLIPIEYVTVSGQVCFWVQIGMQSNSIAETLMTLKPWQCDPFFKNVEKLDDEPTKRIANIELLKFIINKSKDNNINQSLVYEIEQDDFEKKIDKLYSDIHCCLEFVIPMFKDNTFLAEELIKAGNSRLGESDIGLGSSDPYVYAALLLQESNFTERALEILKLGLEKELELNTSSFESNLSETNEITQCRYTKFESFLKIAM